MGWLRDVANNLIAVIVFLLFFAVLLTVFLFAGVVSYYLFILVFVVVLYIIYVLLGGRPLSGRHEKPGRILNKRLRFQDVDWIRETPPNAEVTDYDGLTYTARFIEPLKVNGREVKTARLSARWEGYPVSSAGRWRIVPVNAVLDTGDGFIAMTHMVR